MADSIIETILLQGADTATKSLNALGEAGASVFGRMGDSAKQASGKTEQLSSQLDKTKTSAEKAGTGIQALGSRLTHLGQQIRSSSEQLRQFGRSWSLYVTAPIAGLGTAAVAAFTSFQQQMSNVSTLVDTTKESMSAMGQQVIAISQRVPVALGDLASALYDIRSAGISAKDAMGVLENSAKLAVAGLGTTKEAANIVTSAINAFGLKGKDAQNVYAQIFETVKQGKTTIGELSQGFGSVAAVVAQSGIKLKEFLAATAALTSVGVPASQAYTQIRTALGGLTTQTAQAKQLFDALGVDSFQQLIKRSGGLVAAFKALNQAAEGNSTTLVKAVGGMEGYNAVVTLAVKANKAFENAMHGMDTSSKDFNSAFNKQQQTLSSAMQHLSNSVKALGISFGSSLAPAIKAVAEVLSALANAFAALPSPIRAVLGTVAALAAAVGPVALAVGMFSAGWTKLIPVLRMALPLLSTMRTGILAVRSAMMLATASMGIWPIALAAIAAGIAYLIMWLLDNQKQAASWAKAIAQTVQQAVGVWTSFESTVVGIAKSFVTAFETAAHMVESIFQSLWNNVTGWLEKIVSTLRAIVSLGSQAQSSTGGSGGAGYYRGGLLRGAGSSTSDSIPLWGSTGEYMVKAAAVRHYGVSFMEAINNMRVQAKGFSLGGLIGAPRQPSLRLAQGGLVQSRGNTLNLTIGNETFAGLIMPDDVGDRLTKFAAKRQLASAGKKPTWFGTGKK